jgi:hypothetical protein
MGWWGAARGNMGGGLGRLAGREDEGRGERLSASGVNVALVGCCGRGAQGRLVVVRRRQSSKGNSLAVRVAKAEQFGWLVEEAGWGGGRSKAPW